MVGLLLGKAVQQNRMGGISVALRKVRTRDSAGVFSRPGRSRDNA